MKGRIMLKADLVTVMIATGRCDRGTPIQRAVARLGSGYKSKYDIKRVLNHACEELQLHYIRSPKDFIKRFYGIDVDIPSEIFEAPMSVFKTEGVKYVSN